MCVRADKNGELLPAVKAAGRAMVFLTVPWSVYERSARRAFYDAAGKLAADDPTLNIECFSLDEDADWCQSWLATIVGGSSPLGAGSIIWLEAGQPMLHERSGCRLRSEDIVARAKKMWAQ